MILYQRWFYIRIGETINVITHSAVIFSEYTDVISRPSSLSSSYFFILFNLSISLFIFYVYSSPDPLSLDFFLLILSTVDLSVSFCESLSPDLFLS